ncbi:hypothetical protein [Bifidobacterium lemurum]|uniref:hypothetical protein n=1 Tax=Bifidobacterium lemurum TaxID=1603886 RepID=UPI001303C707|nr:hypothetical protein [Bifidobacterium lemurum]QOL34211.1 hypothetical protein BL8807_10915 [Bifidobacterium lemurum]
MGHTDRAGFPPVHPIGSPWDDDPCESDLIDCQIVLDLYAQIKGDESEETMKRAYAECF